MKHFQNVNQHVAILGGHHKGTGWVLGCGDVSGLHIHSRVVTVPRASAADREACVVLMVPRASDVAVHTV